MQPEIRFEGCNGEWETRKLAELYEYDCSGGTPTVSNESYYGGDIPFLSIADMKDRIIYATDKYITQEGLNRSAAQIVQTGSIAFTMYASVGKVGIIGTDMATSQAFLNMTFCKESVRDFIFTRLEKADNEHEWEPLISMGTQRNLNSQKVRNFKLLIPDIQEQEKIAMFFQHIDKLIATHQQKYESLLKVKKAMLEKMFPKEGAEIPEIRFAGYTYAWEQHRLGDVGEAKSGVGFPDTEQGGTSGIPFYKVSDMNNIGNETEMVKANNYVTPTQIEKYRWVPIENVPAIFFAKVGAAVMLNRKRLCIHPFLLDNNTMAYSLNPFIWEANFAKAIFETIDLTSLVQVGALPSYNTGDVENIKVYIPSSAEQQQIGNLFRLLDRLTSLHQRKCIQLQNVKRAMLQKMFV